MPRYIPLGPEPEDARPWRGPEPEDAIPKKARRAERASPSTVPGLAYAARKPSTVPGQVYAARKPGAASGKGAAPAPDPALRRNGINVCSLLSLVFLVLCPPAAIVFGGLGLRQIRRSGEHGFGLAVFGIAAGALLSLLLAMAVIVLFMLFALPARQ